MISNGLNGVPFSHCISATQKISAYTFEMKELVVRQIKYNRVGKPDIIFNLLVCGCLTVPAI